MKVITRILRCLLSSKMAHTLSMECVSHWISFLSLYYGSFLNSILLEAKNPCLAPIPGTLLRPGTWQSSCAPLSFLQHLFCCPTGATKSKISIHLLGYSSPSEGWRGLVTSHVHSSGPLGGAHAACRIWQRPVLWLGRNLQRPRALDLLLSSIVLSLWTWEDPQDDHRISK